MKSKNQVANVEKNQENVSSSSSIAGQIDGKGPTSEEIRGRAHEIYLERGGGDGRDFDDWLQAERELRASHKSSGTRLVLPGRRQTP